MVIGETTRDTHEAISHCSVDLGAYGAYLLCVFTAADPSDWRLHNRPAVGWSVARLPLHDQLQRAYAELPSTGWSKKTNPTEWSDVIPEVIPSRDPTHLYNIIAYIRLPLLCVYASVLYVLCYYVLCDNVFIL